MVRSKTKKKCVFKKKDYESGDGMLTYVWGPSLWHFLHTMSFNYPVKPNCQDKKFYMNFILNLKNTLPCKYCRINLKKNLKDINFDMKDMKNRDTFSKFIYKLHNHINKMLKKKNKITYEKVRERYENFRSRCNSKKPKEKYICKNTKKCQRLCKCINVNKKIKKSKIKEKGCTEPINGKKSKCIIEIVPLEEKRTTFRMDPRCKANLIKN